MKAAYPVVLKKGSSHIIVFVPDFNINTQGKDMAEALEMAADAIGLAGVYLEDEKAPIPKPSAIDSIKKEEAEILSLVAVDFDEYRRKNDMRTVKKNCTIPSWLCYQAERAGINFSATLQSALKKELHITE